MEKAGPKSLSLCSFFLPDIDMANVQARWCSESGRPVTRNWPGVCMKFCFCAHRLQDENSRGEILFFVQISGVKTF